MSLVAALIPIVSNVLDRVLPDESKKQETKNKIIAEILSQQKGLEIEAAKVIRSETASSHWLAANWRPMLMITFGGLIVARWFGWAAPNLSEAEYIALWDIVELGIGGYVIGRSGEKVLPKIIEVIKK